MPRQPSWASSPAPCRPARSCRPPWRSPGTSPANTAPGSVSLTKQLFYEFLTTGDRERARAEEREAFHYLVGRAGRQGGLLSFLERRAPEWTGSKHVNRGAIVMTAADKTVVVTGAGHGIGRATARRFASDGCPARAGRLQRGDAGRGGGGDELGGATVLPVPFDQRSSTDATSLIDAAIERFGRIDVLATVAGIYPFATAGETTDELWSDVLATNLTGVFYCCRAAMPAMLAAGSGCIVTISSGTAEIPYAGMSAYSASKGGIESLSRVLAKEGAPMVRVNTVAPGPTDDLAARSPTGPRSMIRSTAAATIIDDVPLARWGRPEEIADAIAFWPPTGLRSSPARSSGSTAGTIWREATGGGRCERQAAGSDHGHRSDRSVSYGHDRRPAPSGRKNPLYGQRRGGADTTERPPWSSGSLVL